MTIRQSFVDSEVDVLKLNKKHLHFMCFVVIACMLSIFFILLKSGSERLFTDKEQTTKDIMVHTVSIFLNSLKPTGDVVVPVIDIQMKKDCCYIEGEEYTLFDTNFSATTKTVYWRIDLSQLSLCASSKNIEVFSNNGKYDNDILIIKKDSSLYLLVRNNILDVMQYDLDDFYITEKIESDEYYVALWNVHLSKEKNLSSMLSDEPYKCIWLQLKKHPELFYPLSYCIYNDEFYSYLPATSDKRPISDQNQSGDG